MELARLRDAVREKEARIVQLESGSRMSPSSSTANTSTKKSSQKKGQGQSDSETDVEDEGSHAKRKPKWTPQNFSLSDQDVSDLATVLSNVDSELPYPTPSNLIASLKKIASQQQKGGRSDPSDGNSDRYANLQKEYRRIWSENEALTRKCEKLERSVGANNTPSRDMLEDLDRAKKSAEEYRRKYEASQRLLSEVESQLANAASSKASIRDHEKAVRYLEEKHQREISSLKSRLAQDLDDERGALKSRAEFEMRELASSHSSKIQALESQYKTEIESIKMELTGRDDDVRRKVKREFEDAKRGMELDHELAMDKLRSESRRELEQARRESEEKYKARIADLERKLQQSGLDAARSLERELEENRFQFRKDQETAILKHHEEIDRLREQSANEKSQIQGILDRTQAELDKVQAEFSREQDKLQLQVETLSLDIKKKETENKDVTRQLKEVDSKYTKQISEIETELNKLKSKHQDVTRQLELESAMVEQLKQDISDKETYINELGKTVLDYQKLHENFADVENRFKSELAKKDEIISSLEASVSAEKQKAKNMLEDSVEDKASALDQVERVKRRLAATEQELRRAKEFADEKEAEVLDMKRLLRSQNKQLESALGGSPSADTSMGYSEKKLNDALAEVGVLTSQVATLKKQLDSKEKEIFEVRIEASEAFDKATQLAQSQQDLSKMNSELDMMSQMVLELKTAKVQLMERVDNAEHRENILKSELSLIKSEVGRSKRGTQ